MPLQPGKVRRSLSGNIYGPDAIGFAAKLVRQGPLLGCNYGHDTSPSDCLNYGYEVAIASHQDCYLEESTEGTFEHIDSDQSVHSLLTARSSSKRSEANLGVREQLYGLPVLLKSGINSLIRPGIVVDYPSQADPCTRNTGNLLGLVCPLRGAPKLDQARVCDIIGQSSGVYKWLPKPFGETSDVAAVNEAVGVHGTIIQDHSAPNPAAQPDGQRTIVRRPPVSSITFCVKEEQAETRPAVMAMYKTKLASTLLVVLVGLSCQPKQPEQEPQRTAPPISVDQALSYEVVQREDISSRSRRRLSAFIYSPAQSVEARIQTSMKAAFELQQSTGCDFVKVFHLISPDPSQVGTGTYYADLSYAPDGLGVGGESPLRNGTWEATVSDEVVDSLTLEAEKLWWANRGRFQRADGFGGTETDEKAMKEFIAKQLNVKPEDVHLAIFTRTPYP